MNYKNLKFIFKLIFKVNSEETSVLQQKSILKVLVFLSSV